MKAIQVHLTFDRVKDIDFKISRPFKMLAWRELAHVEDKVMPISTRAAPWAFALMSANVLSRALTALLRRLRRGYTIGAPRFTEWRH